MDNALMEYKIREATDSDLDNVLAVERSAFGGEEEAILTNDLLNDPSAAPCLSLLAFHEQQAVGHILFTDAKIVGEPTLKCSILAPLAVVPKFQKKGVGLALINKGLEILKNWEIDLVFVLGHIEYYPKAGFFPARKIGVFAPYPIPEEVRDAWMVHTLGKPAPQFNDLTIDCAESMMRPENWAE